MNSSSRSARSTATLVALGLLTIVNAVAVAILARPIGEDVPAAGSRLVVVALALGAVLVGTVLARWWLAELRDRSVSGRLRTLAGEHTASAGSNHVSRGRDRFFLRLSQELRRPLLTALADVHALRSGEAESKRDALDRIERDLRQQTRLISVLEDASRPVRSHTMIPVSPVDVSDLLDQIVTAHQSAFDECGQRIERLFEDHPVSALADSRRLEQAVGALLSNATKFTPAGGVISIDISSSDDQVVISVSDTGVGFDRDTSALLFDPILREDILDGPLASGPGLGLAMASRLVARQGGMLFAQSDGPGKGSTFRIALLKSRFAAAPGSCQSRHSFAASDSSSTSLGRLEQIRVLVVDDESVNRESLHVLLETCGADVRAASSAAEARRVFDSWRPDVVITDLSMPGEDGYELLVSIRKRTDLAGGAVPVIALTGRDDVEEQFKTLSAGFQSYIAKPADPRELVKIVRELSAQPVPASREGR